jgi:hypothetical protein
LLLLLLLLLLLRRCFLVANIDGILLAAADLGLFRCCSGR